MSCTPMMKNFLLYPTDPINYGEEIVDIRKRIGNIENILNEVLQKVSAKKPELELNLPGPSQPLDASITDEDLESIFSGFCASSPPFQSPDFVGPSLPGPSSQCRSPFFPRQQIPLRPRSLSVPTTFRRAVSWANVTPTFRANDTSVSGANDASSESGASSESNASDGYATS